MFRIDRFFRERARILKLSEDERPLRALFPFRSIVKKYITISEAARFYRVSRQNRAASLEHF